MHRIAVASLSLFLIFPIACNSGSNSSAGSSSLNLAGTWTVATLSTQGHGGSSGTAVLTQSGQGLGTNGSTTIAATIGQIVVSQTGTALTGTIKNSLQGMTFSFAGTLSGSNFTVAGSTPCPGSSSIQVSTSIAGTITSSAIQGTYTITRGSGCYYPSDAGTFVATKK